MPTVPGELSAATMDPSSTATVVGTDIVAATGQVARWIATGAAGNYTLNLATNAPFGAKVTVRVGGVAVYSRVIFEEEAMGFPSKNTVESTVTSALSGATAVRADATPLANRCRIRLVNTDQTTPNGVRVYVGRGATLAAAQANAGASTAEVIESDYGTWQDDLDASQFICVRSSSASVAPVIRVIQYATA